jgi:hypothetical protein
MSQTVSDSTKAGYLAPTSVSSADSDIELATIFQGAVVGIVGLPGNMVRPRWQPQPPPMPPPNVDWCAIGVTVQSPIDFPVLKMSPDGTQALQRQEEITVQASFYGLNAQSNAGLLRDGIFVAQNLDVLAANGIKLITAGEIVQAPDLRNEQFIGRCDLPLRFRRQVDRVYPVRYLVSAPDTITLDAGVVATGTIEPP